MPSPLDNQLRALFSVQLGDVIQVPNFGELNVRVRTDLAHPIGPMICFVICGDLAAAKENTRDVVLLAFPLSDIHPVGVFTPIDFVPEHVKNGVVVERGFTKYRAPHLQNQAGGQGEIAYSLVEVAGEWWPVVVTSRYKGERTTWIAVEDRDPNELKAILMPRPQEEDEYTVVRETTKVIPRRIIVPEPIPAEPQKVPERVPEHAPL